MPIGATARSVDIADTFVYGDTADRPVEPFTFPGAIGKNFGTNNLEGFITSWAPIFGPFQGVTPWATTAIFAATGGTPVAVKGSAVRRAGIVTVLFTTGELPPGVEYDWRWMTMTIPSAVANGVDDQGAGIYDPSAVGYASYAAGSAIGIDTTSFGGPFYSKFHVRLSKTGSIGFERLVGTSGRPRSIVGSFTYPVLTE